MTNSNRKKILVIGAGWEQEALIETIHRQKHTIIASNPSINAPGLNYAAQYYVKDSRDIESHLKIAATHKIDAVITDNCDYSFFTAAIVAEKFNLPFASTKSAYFSNDKFLQRSALNRTAVKQPNFRGVRTLEEARQAAAEIGFPAILKPIDSRGTFGITILKDETELENAYFYAITNSPSRSLIIENFINGTLVTVDGFCFSNKHVALAVASRKYTDGNKPITKEIIYPGFFSDEVKAKLLRTHEEVVQSLGYSYGHTHGEYLVTAQGEIYLVECTNRGGGVYTSSVIVPFLTQIDLNSILVNQSLGIDDYVFEHRDGGHMKKSAILAFLDYEIGKVVKEINIGEMKEEPYTLRFRSKYGVNEMVESIENGSGRHSMVVIGGDSREDALHNFASFKQKLSVTYY
jgi:biotin carboxylase